MKFVVIFALICAGICYADPQRTFTTAGKTNATVLNIENIYAERTMYKVHNQTVTLPRTTWPFIITGIRHIDNKYHPVHVELISGGIGHKTATFNIVSDQGYGINSTFLFYGKLY